MSTVDPTAPPRKKRGRPTAPNTRRTVILAGLAMGADSSRVSQTAISQAVARVLHREPSGRDVNRILKHMDTAAAAPACLFIAGTGEHAETGERHHMAMFLEHAQLTFDRQTGAILERRITGLTWIEGMREAERLTWTLTR